MVTKLRKCTIYWCEKKIKQRQGDDLSKNTDGRDTTKQARGKKSDEEMTFTRTRHRGQKKIMGLHFEGTGCTNKKVMGPLFEGTGCTNRKVHELRAKRRLGWIKGRR